MPITVDPYRKRLMIDFHMLIDTDLGSAIYLQMHAKNRKLFQDHIPDVNVFYLQYMALTRKEENPIEYMFKEQYKGHADNIYGELMTEKWDSVLNHSPTTDILKVVYSGYKSAGYKITINCRNEEEVKRVKLITHDWHSIIDVKDTSIYFCLYLHDVVSILRNNYDVKGKSIYLYDYSKNHANDDMSNNNKDINPVAARWKNSTIFKFISPYSTFKMPKG